MRKVLLFLVIAPFCFLPPVQAEIKTFVHTVRQPFSGSQSPDDARVAGTHDGQRRTRHNRWLTGEGSETWIC